MTATSKKLPRRTPRFTPSALQDRLEKIQAGWQTSERHDRAILAQARQIQLCKLAGLCSG
jgi:hypothetical protein